MEEIQPRYDILAHSSVLKRGREVNDMSTEVMRFIKARAHLEPEFRAQLMSNPWQFLQQYDLTEDEKREIILPNFSWLIENSLAAMPYPLSEVAFTLLHEMGIRAILNLTERPYPYVTPATLGML